MNYFTNGAPYNNAAQNRRENPSGASQDTHKGMDWRLQPLLASRGVGFREVKGIDLSHHGGLS